MQDRAGQAEQAGQAGQLMSDNACNLKKLGVHVKMSVHEKCVK